MAQIHGSPGDAGLQMPAVAGAGTEPVPYAGPGVSTEPPVYAAAPLDMSPADGYVVHPVTNLGTAQTPYSLSAADTSGAAPYYPGAIGPINAAGDNDAGGRDTVAGDVAGAVANATGRWQENQGYAMAQGGTAGDLMQFPPSPLDPGAGVGNTLPTAGFYDPDRDYGGTQGAPGYQGEAQ